MEGPVIHWVGAVIGLIVAIVLIFRKVNPVYALFGGAIIGGLLGGASLDTTVQYVIQGTNSVMGAVVRVLAAGVLAGILIESGAAERIAETIVNKLGDKKALFSIALASLIITSVGVFITVAIIIVAPIALSVGKKIGLSKTALLLALVGGGKAGNVISPNPNTIAVAKGFDVDLAQVMIAGFLPAIAGLIVTVIVARFLMHRGVQIEDTDPGVAARGGTAKENPSFARSMVAPVVAVVLLGINPLGNILNIPFMKEFKIDSMIILPLAGIIGLIAMKQGKKLIAYSTSGLNKMTSTAIILIGAGAIAGIISKSDLSAAVVQGIDAIGISGTLLAPIAGILMGAATASTSTASIVAAGSFGPAILSMGTAPLNAAVMVHTGATVIDQLPHGNFFHVTADAVKMNIKNRMSLIPYEAIVGLTMTIVATILYGFIF